MTILYCQTCSHAQTDHDIKADPDEPRCQRLVSDEDDPTEGNHRTSSPGVTEDDTYHCYQAHLLFSSSPR